MLQTAHLLILPLTAILYVAAKEQPDVEVNVINSDFIFLILSWYIPLQCNRQLWNTGSQDATRFSTSPTAINR